MSLWSIDEGMQLSGLHAARKQHCSLFQWDLKTGAGKTRFSWFGGKSILPGRRGEEGFSPHVTPVMCGMCLVFCSMRVVPYNRQGCFRDSTSQQPSLTTWTLTSLRPFSPFSMAISLANSEHHESRNEKKGQGVRNERFTQR